jgi:outer membrane protein assembly factor BamB
LADPQATQLKLPKTSCGYTTPTPASDGQRVAVVLGSGIVACYDIDGNRQWIRYLDCEQPPEYGRSASPLIVGDKLIVQVSHLIALDLHTGQTIWQVPDATESYGSPIAFRLGSADLVATPEGHLVRADDGKVLAAELAKTSHVTPIYHDRRLFFIDLLAVACELSETASGTITTRELWTQDLEDEFFASPVHHENLIYTVNNIGTLFVLDASTGKIVLQKDLDLPSPAVSGSDEPPPIPNFYPSLSLAGKSLFLGTDRGGAVWLRPGRVYQEQGRIQLKEGAAATPVFSGRQMYLRSGKQLWCVED